MMELNPIKAIFDVLSRMSPRARTRLWKLWYDLLPDLDADNDLLFMNYGYAGPDSTSPGLDLATGDERYRYCIQLYHRVWKDTGIEGQRTLEVGCGRGGGAAYVARQLRPALMVGMDFSPKALRLCRELHSESNLAFACGRAELLPFADELFDVVASVESSHAYASSELFFSEARRVLRHKGVLLLADFRDRCALPALRKQMEDSGLEIVREDIITPCVVRALDLDHDRKLHLIRRKVPRPLVKVFLSFAATRDSKTYRSFASRESEYFHFVLRKP